MNLFLWPPLHWIGFMKDSNSNNWICLNWWLIDSVNVGIWYWIINWLVYLALEYDRIFLMFPFFYLLLIIGKNHFPCICFFTLLQVSLSPCVSMYINKKNNYLVDSISNQCLKCQHNYGRKLSCFCEFVASCLFPFS